ncbi:Chemotaxis protein CheA [Gammaproteobacteria bacterium]
MNINLGIFHAAFFDETAEHLEEMERLLIELDLESPSSDALNAIFRAAHSIKGGAGTFGFNDMAELTHVLESLLDRLRKAEMLPTPEMVDAFLAAADVIQGQLAAHRSGKVADPALAKTVAERLEVFLGLPTSETGTESSKSSEDTTDRDSGELLSSPATLNRQRWRICLSLPARSGWGMDSLLEEWNRRGTLKVVSSPKAGQIGGDWEVHFSTTDTEHKIREDLAFYADPSQIQIEQMSEEEEDSTSAKSESEDGFGFFEDAPGAPDLGYGFFTPISEISQESSQETTEETRPNAVPYGIFSGAPGAPVEGIARTSPTAAVSPPSFSPSQDIVLAKKSEGNSIRVGVEKVDQIMNLVGELVITQSMLAQVASQLDPTWTIRLQSGLDQLERNTRNLQESVMSIRMMPISVVFSRFPRLVRDLASKLGKRVELITLGEGTELDKGLTEKLSDPLTHLVRNSLDHGIESPEIRAAKGKEAVGRITLSASHQGGNVVIEVRDDGAGLNRDRILAKAREKGLATGESLSDQEVWQLIFAPGFSTAEQVTDVSGRGVGMDVVRRNIQEIGGTVEISSMAGIGSTFTVRLPLTLAILDGLSVSVGEETFIISLGYIMESMRPKISDLRTVAGKGRLVRVRGEYLPILPLYELFGIASLAKEPEEGILVLLEAEGRRVALFVDQLVGQHQVVIKSLESNFRRVDGISGATIMGDGRVALILDVGYLARRATRVSTLESGTI